MRQRAAANAAAIALTTVSAPELAKCASHADPATGGARRGRWSRRQSRDNAHDCHASRPYVLRRTDTGADGPDACDPGRDLARDAHPVRAYEAGIYMGA